MPARSHLLMAILVITALALVATRVLPGGLRFTREGVSSPEGPPVAGARGRLAYVRDGDIWTYDLRVGIERRLTQTGDTSAPRWAATGGWIAFERGGRLWAMRADGRGAFAVPGGDIPGSGRWSPRGVRLAYASSDGSLSVLDAPDGEGGRRVVVPAGSGVGPNVAWSNDSVRVAYARHQAVGPGLSNEGIWSITAQGRDPIPVYVASGAFSLHVCCWTYSDQYILFWMGAGVDASAGDGLPLYVARAGSSQPVVVADVAPVDPDLVDTAPRSDAVALIAGGAPSMSSGKRLVVAEPHERAGNRLDVETAVVEGRREARPSNPAWAPQGTLQLPALAYALGLSLEASQGDVAATLTGRRILLWRSDGTQPRHLLPEATVPSDVSDERPMWARDGKTVLFARRLDPAAAVQNAGGTLAGVELWVATVDGASAKRVAGGLLDPGAGRDGYVEWGDLFDYYRG